jgi:hypothetical protein
MITPNRQRCGMYTAEERVRISPGLMFILLAGISFQLCCARHMANYANMEIDPKTLKVQLRNELPFPGSPTSDYYFRFQLSGGRYTVDHFAPGGKVRYNAFWVNADDTISDKTKYQVLLSGPFGTVYAESDYFYDSYYKGQPTTFSSVPYFNDVRSEPFQLASALPATENLRLNAISVIRIFHAPPEFLIVSANYSPDGRLESLHVNGAKHGDWVHSNEVRSLYPDLDVATLSADWPGTRERFGIPAAFPVQEYQRSPANIFHPVKLNDALDVVNFHYERNRWVRQDSFLPDGTRQTRFLTYLKTHEDEILEPIDSSRQFGEFQPTAGGRSQ